MYPSGHVQTALCLTTLQFALGAHTFGAAQGLIHFLAWHAVQSGQSLLDKQPLIIGGGVAYSKEKIHSILIRTSSVIVRTYPLCRQFGDFRCSQEGIHILHYGTLTCKWHCGHSLSSYMQGHKCQKNTFWLHDNHDLSHIEALHQLKKG